MAAFGTPVCVRGEVGATVSAFNVVLGAGELVEGDSNTPSDTHQGGHTRPTSWNGFRVTPSWREPIFPLLMRTPPAS